ncbi:MAG: hypothetical protein WD042_05740 [Phycisphaeraceae bacterium]
MNFSTDRDLLALEPNLFADVSFLAQQRLSVTDGVLGGTTLTSATADFAAARIDPGDVVLIAAVPHEVMSRQDAHTLTVSLLRNALSDPAIPAPASAGSGLEVIARTFAPQAALIHDMLLHLLGIDPDAPEADEEDIPNGVLTEDAVVSLSAMARLEALGTLERLYAAAASLAGDNEPLWRKATWARDQFYAALHRASIRIDTDNDGRADTTRRFALANLVRV